MITVVVGPPCSGKSTIVAQRMKAGDIRLDWNLLVRAVGGDDAPRRVDGTLHRMIFALRQTIIRNVTGGIWLDKADDANAWMIHSAIPKAQVTEYEQAGARFLLVDPGEDTCLQRAEARDGDEAENTQQAIRNWYANPPELPEGTKREKALTMKSTGHLGRRQFELRNALTVLKADTPAGDNVEPGTITALVSVFGNVDRGGDVVAPNAFDKTIAAWQASGRSIPMVWSHAWEDPRALIGQWTGMQATEEGLQLTGKVDIDQEGTWAAIVHQDLMDGKLHDFSFAGDVRDGTFIETSDESIFQITDIDLFEAGPCLIGMNPEARPVSVKTAPHPDPDPDPPDPPAGPTPTEASDDSSGAFSMPAAAKRAVVQLTAALL